MYGGYVQTEHFSQKAYEYIAILDRSALPTDLVSSRAENFKTHITDVAQIDGAVEGTLQCAKDTEAVLGGVINCAGVGTAAKIIDAHGEPHSLDLWNSAIDMNLSGPSRSTCHSLL